MHHLYMIRTGSYGVDGAAPPAYPHFLYGALEVIDWADHPWCDVLIGMDVLSLCDLVLRRSGAFRLDLP